MVGAKRALQGVWRLLPVGARETLNRWRIGRRDRTLRAGWTSQIRRAAEEISAHCLRGSGDHESWEATKDPRREKLRWMLGLEPGLDRTPLNPRVTGRFERASYTAEKLVFESLPGLLVTGTLYLPKGVSAPAPCVLYLCGHQIHPLGAKTQYQERYLWYPAHGFACLVLDSLECGEVQGIHHGTHSGGFWHWLSLGYTPAGVEVWNAMRALDYLESRPEVDASRVGATGVSGGGVMTWYLSALDERVRVAAPSSSAYTVGSQVARPYLHLQCDCTFYPNAYRMDFPEVGALIAPRPLLILGGKRDRIFPPVGYREVYEKVRGLYGLHGSPECIRLAEVNDGHADSARSLREARAWMVRWLKSQDDPAMASVDDSAPSGEPAESLACLSEIPPEAANFTIHHTFVRPHRAEVPASAPEWEARKRELLDALRATTFGWFPEGSLPFHASRLAGSGGHAQRFARFGAYELDSEPGARVRVQLYEPHRGEEDAPLLVVVKRRGDSAEFPDDELLPLFRGHRVLVLEPRFVRWEPTPVEYASAERRAALGGRTLAALQVWDAVRAVRWALDGRGMAPGRTTVFGRGTAGIVGLYAALFEPRVGRVVLDVPPASHLEGPAMLAVLRHTDIPEVAGALAPRELVFLSEPAPDFEATRRIYGLMGCPGRLRGASSLPEALSSDAGGPSEAGGS